jgi:hypothetical protein
MQAATYLNEEQTKTYQNLSRLASQIQEAVSAFDLAVLQADIPDEVKLRCLNLTLNTGLQGLAYRLHPQSEWAGGNSFNTRSPHIANE